MRIARFAKRKTTELNELYLEFSDFFQKLNDPQTTSYEIEQILDRFICANKVHLIGKHLTHHENVTTQLLDKWYAELRYKRAIQPSQLRSCLLSIVEAQWVSECAAASSDILKKIARTNVEEWQNTDLSRRLLKHPNATKEIEKMLSKIQHAS